MLTRRPCAIDWVKVYAIVLTSGNNLTRINSKNDVAFSNLVTKLTQGVSDHRKGRRRKMTQKTPKKAIHVIALAITILGTCPAAAQDAPDSGQSALLIDKITACRAIADAGRRLTCFDQAAVALAKARSERQMVVLDRGEVRQKRQSLFGLRLPEIQLFGREEAKEPEIREVRSKVVRLAPFGRDQWTVWLDQGGVWRTTEKARFDPEVGQSVRIFKAAMGSFRASFNGNLAVRIERVE